MCHMTPGHTGLPHKTRTTETGGRCFRPIFVMHTCPLRRNSSPAVYSVDMGRVYIHWRRLCGLPRVAEKFARKIRIEPPRSLRFPPPPPRFSETSTLHGSFSGTLWPVQLLPTPWRVPIIHRPFYVQPSLLPVQIFLQDFFLWLLPPLLE